MTAGVLGDPSRRCSGSKRAGATRRASRDRHAGRPGGDRSRGATAGPDAVDVVRGSSVLVTRVGRLHGSEARGAVSVAEPVLPVKPAMDKVGALA